MIVAAIPPQVTGYEEHGFAAGGVAGCSGRTIEVGVGRHVIVQIRRRTRDVFRLEQHPWLYVGSSCSRVNLGTSLARVSGALRIKTSHLKRQPELVQRVVVSPRSESLPNGRGGSRRVVSCTAG